MTGRERHMVSKLDSRGPAMKAAAEPQSRTLIPPITPKVIFRALFGVLLFFCGIVLGVWLIIRFRHIQDGNGLNA